MDAAAIPFMTVAELSEVIESREVSPVEVTQAYLDRIDQVDDKLHAYITVCAEEALAAAREAERAISAGGYLGPMHGIPVAVKDQIKTKGILTTWGSRILEDYVPDEDATVIANLKRSGAILLGKHNMSGFAMGDGSDHPYGTPRNPWSLEHSPGATSSGSGAATAASLCATSLGEDTTGSIRGPASFCGVVGIRPTYGRVSRFGVLGTVWSMDTIGPISKTVEDCSITFRAIAGHDPRDQYTWPTPVPDYRQFLDGDVKGMKIGVIKERADSQDVEPDIKEAVDRAISLLEQMGASIEEVSIPLIDYSTVIFQSISRMEAANVHGAWIRERLDDFPHGIRVRHLWGSILPAQAYYKGLKLRAMLREQVLQALANVDVILQPTSPVPAPRIASAAPPPATKERVKAGFFGRNTYTSTANVANIPAMSVPCGFTSSQPTLPIGLQIFGKPFDEVTMFKVAHAYEQNTNWHTQRPPV